MYVIYMFLYVSVCTWVCMCVPEERLTLGVFFSHSLPYFLRQGQHGASKYGAPIQLAHLPLSPPIPSAEVTDKPQSPAFVTLDSGSHSCKASTLFMKPLPQPCNVSFLLFICISPQTIIYSLPMPICTHPIIHGTELWSSLIVDV